MPGKKTPKTQKKMPTKRDISIIAEESSLSLVSDHLCLSTNAFAKAGSGKVTRGDAEWSKRVLLPLLPLL